jgi:hypothetical protein
MRDIFKAPGKRTTARERDLIKQLKSKDIEFKKLLKQLGEKKRENSWEENEYRMSEKTGKFYKVPAEKTGKTPKPSSRNNTTNQYLHADFATMKRLQNAINALNSFKTKLPKPNKNQVIFVDPNFPISQKKTISFGSTRVPNTIYTRDAPRRSTRATRQPNRLTYV